MLKTSSTLWTEETKATMFVFTLSLLMSFLAHVSGMEEPCESPQYVMLGETGTIQCNFVSGFFGIFWYNTTDYIDEYSVLNLKESGISGPGYTSGEFGIYPNGSLIIMEVTMAHNRTFTVVKLETVYDEVVPHFVTIIVQVFPTPPYPIIGGCHQERSCVREVNRSGNLTCSVLGIHPRVDLEWRRPHNKSSINLLNIRQHATRRDDGRFDVHLISEFSIDNTSEYSQTVECRVLNTNGAQDLNLVSKVFLLFPEGSPMITSEKDVKDDTSGSSSHGLLIFLIIFIVLVVASLILAGAVFVKRRANGINHSSLEMGSDIAEEAEEADEEQRPLLDEAQQSEELQNLISKLQLKYKSLYDATEPIPHIRSKNKGKEKIFIESGLQSLNYREGGGKHGIWENVESVEAVLKDPGFKSKKLILVGNHGYIKSTLGVELAYDWCTVDKSSFTKEFEVLIYLKLSELNNATLDFNSLTQVLLGKEGKTGEKSIEEILTQSSRVGVLLDGFNYSPYREQDSSLDVKKLILIPIFKSFTVILISAPPLLENIYHLGNIKRLRVVGVDKQTQQNFISLKVATGTNDSNKRGFAEQKGCNSITKETPQLVKSDCDEISDMEKTGKDSVERGAAELVESDSVVNYSASKTASDVAEVTNVQNDGKDSAKESMVSMEENNPAEKDSVQMEEYLLPLDLLDTPLFFSILSQISKKNDAKIDYESITKFFFQMTRYLERETNEEKENEKLGEDTLMKPKQYILNKIAYNSISFDQKATKFWSKQEICEQLGNKFYESCKLKGYFIEEGIPNSKENESNDDASLKILVRFSTTFFCEWFAAHHISNTEWNKKQLEDTIMKLISNNYWYCIRFLCALNGDLGKKILKLMKGRGAMLFLCDIEKNGSISNSMDTVRMIFSKDVFIKLKDSRLEQMSLIQLLHTKARNQIPIQHLFLEDCFNSPSSSSYELVLRSGLELPILSTLVRLDLVEEGRMLTETEAEAIFTYSLKCDKLKILRFSKCLLPQTLRGLSVPSDIESKSLQVEWETQSQLGNLSFEFAERQWKTKKGKYLTQDEYNVVVKKFNNLL